jgi:hypothetical protein
MRALENKVEEVNDVVKDTAHLGLLPCEYFDLIVGTSTGGSESTIGALPMLLATNKATDS